MPNYSVDYIVYTAGHRHHHAGTQTHLLPTGNGPCVNGTSFPVFAFDSLPYQGIDLPFAFMSVVGNTDDTHLYTSPGLKDVTSGNSDIKITIVYAPKGGGDGHGGPGIWVDAFNVDIGDFSDSDFMSVYTNGVLDNAKTATANNDGVVSSATAEDMRAYSSVDGVPFLEWNKVEGAITANQDYMLAAQEGGIAFAFYQSPKKVQVNVPGNAASSSWIWLSPGVLVDAGGWGIGPDGKPHPIDPWGPLFMQLVTAIGVLSLSTNMDQRGKEMAKKLAIEQLESAKAAIAKIGTETKIG